MLFTNPVEFFDVTLFYVLRVFFNFFVDMNFFLLNLEVDLFRFCAGQMRATRNVW